ncbi:hypothetical protein [Campylobacter sp. RM16189]|uniref:hypothetical protein n=1 Tax=Campylobacter sp. RM16189 TaxID=1705726 RepID=UPI0014750FF6|nr:hypothetical protein [Campylobacter sp. RM16189]
MILRYVQRDIGMADYMIGGEKAGYKETRDDKDKVIPLIGDIYEFQKEERLINDDEFRKRKGWKKNYLSITVSFSREDMMRLNSDPNKKYQTLQEIAKIIIDTNTSGHTPDEITAFAEVHAPKRFKNDEKQRTILKDGKIIGERDEYRYEHIHIGISKRNYLDDSQISLLWTGNIGGNDIIQQYINKKYGFENPKDYSRDRKQNTMQKKIALTRKAYQEALKDIQSLDELYAFLKEQEVEYKIIQTKKNKYIKIINPNRGKRGQRGSDGADLNIKGRGFEHIDTLFEETLTDDEKISRSPKFQREKTISDLSLEELEEALTNLKQKRTEWLEKRRSKKLKQLISEVGAKEQEEEPELKPLTFYQNLSQEELKYLEDDESMKDELKKLQIREQRPINEADYHLQEIEEAEKAQQEDMNRDFLKISNNLSLETLVKYIEEKKGELLFDRLVIPSQDEIKSANKQFIYRYRQNSQTPAKMSPRDILREQLNLSGVEAFEVMKKIYNNEISFSNSHVLPQPVEFVEVYKNKRKNYSQNVITARTMYALLRLTSQYRYSRARTRGIYRDFMSITDIGNLLVFSVEKKKNANIITIDEAYEIFRKNQFRAIFAPTSSQNFKIIVPMEMKPDFGYMMLREELKKYKASKPQGAPEFSSIFDMGRSEIERQMAEKYELSKEFSGIIADHLEISNYIEESDHDPLKIHEKSTYEKARVQNEGQIITEEMIRHGVMQAQIQIDGKKTSYEESATPKSKSGIILKSGGLNPLQMS